MLTTIIHSNKTFRLTSSKHHANMPIHANRRMDSMATNQNKNAQDVTVHLGLTSDPAEIVSLTEDGYSDAFDDLSDQEKVMWIIEHR